MYSRQHSFFHRSSQFPHFLLSGCLDCACCSAFPPNCFSLLPLSFFQRVPSLLIVSPVFLLACQRGRVGKAAQLTPPSAAAPFRPLTPEVVRSGGRNTAQDESCKRAPTAGAASPPAVVRHGPGDEPPARNGASAD